MFVNTSMKILILVNFNSAKIWLPQVSLVSDWLKLLKYFLLKLQVRVISSFL